VTRRRGRRLATIAAALLALCGSAGAAPVGLQTDVRFTDYSPLSGNAELARRLLSPLTVAKIPQALARAGAGLSAQPIDLAGERFVIYVPPVPPPGGYGLMVFVPPWPEAKLPLGWAPVLHRYGLIFVSAARSDNETSALARREPLALLAEQNIVRRYKVDPQRVYVAGFSGGSRIAMRLALGYPDVFRGALMNAGSDPIGDGDIPLPPRDLFQQFQQSTRLVYVSGQRDVVAVGRDGGSAQSMRNWCVFDLEAEVTPWVSHAAADPAALDHALDALTHPRPPDPGKLAACRAGLETKVTAELDQAQALIARGHRPEAQKLLEKIDRRFGGLAAPRSVELSGEAGGP
jgi:Esterase PHB depolymerase